MEALSNSAPRFIGDGRYPARDPQKDYLKHLYSVWHKHKTFGAHLPPGYGKSWLGKTIQNAIGSDCMIITVSNHLLNQFKETYTDLNHIKGRVHYKNNADYQRAYSKAAHTPSIANPLSYYYGVISGRLKIPKVLIVDEAHKLYETMFLASYMDFDVRALNIPTFKDNYELIEWAQDTKDFLDSKLEQTHKLSGRNLSEFFSLVDKMTTLNEMIKQGCHTFTFDYTYIKSKEGRLINVLRISPIKMEKEFFWPFTMPQKLFLMSGTLTKFDLKFFDKDADYYTGDYLTRPEFRKIYYKPLPESRRKNPEEIANKIKEIYEKEGRPNTVIHVTYAMSKLLAPLIPEAITHTKASKDKAVHQFKLDGGILLAAGCAEGIDLPDSQCELIIIPNLLYPNLGDETVRKRKSLTGGNFRYTLSTMMTTIQQLGRGSRHANDKCVSYILDPQFSFLYQQTYEYIPNDLNIEWGI